ncbi:MAG: CDP-paratose 2-epimerase, partial [Elusimicrobiota bacterium]|nr:CDP-paratose 2-epimerase [Endomicrobiia bacterium]MDW8166714.1 CDP-paratose 2-epimerase [Elusimicrobiota bacterium]
GGGKSNSLSILELFSMLEYILGIRIKYKSLPPRQSDQKVFIADISKAKALIGWEPFVSKGEGMVRILDWSEYLAS